MNFSNDPRKRELMDAALKAQEAYDKACQNFEAIIAQVPSGLPHPDGQARIQIARCEVSYALGVYHRAIDRHIEFLLHDTIPDDQPKSD